MEDRVSALEKQQEKLDGEINQIYDKLNAEFKEFNQTLHSIDRHLAESNLDQLKADQRMQGRDLNELKVDMAGMMRTSGHAKTAAYTLWGILIPVGLGLAHLLVIIWEKLIAIVEKLP